MVDRRRLKRRLVFWRTLAVLAVVACVLVALRPAASLLPGHLGAADYVARLTVDGIITEDPQAVDGSCARLADDDRTSRR